MVIDITFGEAKAITDALRNVIWRKQRDKNGDGVEVQIARMNAVLDKIRAARRLVHESNQ